MPYRLHDIDLREPLFEWVEARLGKVRILEEVEIGRSRADALLVTEGGLIGMEIKSDADTCPHTNRAHKLSPLWRPERAAYRRAHRR
ncbi:MAG: hypothetical protein U0L51_03780 [Olegusella sp.]|nr:hypothetical protein [Olegusella sp.]